MTDMEKQLLRRSATLFLVLFLALMGAAPALAEDDWGDDAADEGGLTSLVEIHGFVEGAFGTRVLENPVQSGDMTLGEGRFRLDLAHYGDRASAQFKGDVVADAVIESVDIDFREGVIVFTPVSWMDVRAGRQVLTWGTGDFVFLNDLFPKDWVAFFIGRDDEFLKAPSNSIKVSFYSGAANLDLVWTPIFEPDRFFTAERLSFFDPSIPGLRGEATPFTKVNPPKEFQNGELAGRLYKTVSGYELAAYGYVGFSSRPTAFDPILLMPTYSRLAVYGASARGQFAGGILNLEGAFHDSWDDRKGTDPFTPNSQARGLVGYDRELFTNFQVGLQYYLEWILEHDALLAASPTPQYEADELRHLITTRLTWRLLRDNLTLSLFVFVSPSDKDAYLRPSVSYRFSDQLSVAVGGNALFGADDHTFFGSLEENANVYTRARYSF